MANRYSAISNAGKNYASADPVRNPDGGKGQRVRRAADKPKIVMKHNERKAGSVLSIFMISILSLAMLGSVIYTLDQRNELYNQISERNSTLSALQAENVRLQSERDSKMTLKNVEEYAETVLGMQKLDKSHIEYIRIQTDDVVNIPAKEDNVWIKIKNFFNHCVEYLRG